MEPELATDPVLGAAGWSWLIDALESHDLDYIAEGDHTVFEGSVLKKLIADQQLAAYRHTGFWRPMDNLRDKIMLEDLWQTGEAPWRTW